MDKALELKMKLEDNEILSQAEAQEYLNASELYGSLLADFDFSALNLLWRLTLLSEIPYAGNSHKVKEWLNKLVEFTYTGEGFSLNGKDDYLLACYNGMITSILLKLKYPDEEKIRKGIGWILKYQNVERGQDCNWEGSGLKKYGGCMKKIPCYIGLVKSMIALSDFKRSQHHKQDIEIEPKLNGGLEYILNQNIFLRLSDNKPITKEITKLSYPFSWKTNIIEILRLIGHNNLLNDKRCAIAKDYLIGKRKKDGFWWAQSASIQKNKAWVVFDKSRQSGMWISYEINKVLQ